jgi:TPR repeat protein/Flp pilus assembly protein TadD
MLRATFTHRLESVALVVSRWRRNCFSSMTTCLCLVVLAAYAGAQQPEQSQPANGDTNNSELAWDLLVEKAEQGDPDAQNELGFRLEQGRGTTKDATRAAAWYRKAAEQGHSAAQSNYGVCLLLGRGVDRNVPSGIAWLRKSAAQNDSNGLWNLAYALEQGYTGRKQIATAAELYRRAAFAGQQGVHADLQRLAETGNAAAQYNYAVLLEYGAGVKKDLAAARAWQAKAAAQNYTDALTALGFFCHNGAGGPKDLPKAVECFRKAAQQGSARAQNALAECYFNGIGIEKDEKKAIALVKLAAAKDLPVALTSHGWLYANGHLGDADFDQAADYYYRAAVLGHERGEKLLRELADKGNATAVACLQRLESGDTDDVSKADSDAILPDVPQQTPEAAAELLTWLKKYESGDYNEAIDGLYDFVQQHPQDDIAWYILGNCYQEKEMPWEAKLAMDRAISLAPAKPEAYTSKAGLLIQQKRFHEAAKTLEQAAQRAPLTRRLLERLVSTESEAKRFLHVIRYGEMLWALQESQSAAFALALAHHFLGDQVQRDEYVAAYQRLGGEPDRLQKIFETSERLQQDKEKILGQLKLVGKRGGFEAVLEQVRRYLNYDPCAAEIWLLLGLIRLNDPLICTNAEIRAKLAKYKDYADAIEHLSNACYLEEQDVLLRQKLAKAMVDNGEFERARAEYERIMQRFPDVATTYSYAALLALKMTDYDRAIHLAERAREIDDHNGEVLAWLAVVYHFADQEQKRDEIRAVIDKLVEQDTTPLDEMFALNKYWDYGYYGNSAVAQDLVKRLSELTGFLAAESLGTDEYRRITGSDYAGTTMRLDLSDEELKWRRRQLFRACRAYLEQYPKSFYVQLFRGHICSCVGTVRRGG